MVRSFFPAKQISTQNCLGNFFSSLINDFQKNNKQSDSQPLFGVADAHHGVYSCNFNNGPWKPAN